ncbi:unnamed protein product [Didymodactylos carnosus]|uniref:Dynein light chain roadblock n=1 Tax=Didymodactylos carnosus TaxID=1234261 RepID=A0A814W8G7_9BILA|nr:unnamed protein product [Didymodactylos carnosus]CAF1197949.1 unnamed protein product [Didymodactylos carnosus]CAF3610691.1 unnamed protein product [Didymodactylos carnosus]CAF3962348.1 unnamed protein product [Didymodactylos carnosus]
MSQAEVEETIKRIQTHKGVQGFIIVSTEGGFVRSTIDNSTTMSLSGLVKPLADKARSAIRDLDPQNDLTFLRIRTKKQEILVAPDKDYLTVVLQATEQA